MNKKIFKLVLLIFIIIFLVCIIPFTKSKYESTSVTTFKNEVAIYLFETSFKNIDITIPDLSPSEKPYIYNFTISNSDGTNISEVNIEYELYIKTTTNLPLQYELYLNEDYTNPNSTNLFKNEKIEKDEYGTFYRKIGIDKRYFGYEQIETDIYTLVINFPVEYNNALYENCIESIELIIDSKQKLD